MLRKFVSALVIGLFLSAYTLADENVKVEPAAIVNNVVNQEVKDAVFALQNQAELKDRAAYIRFFTTYAVPEDKREREVLNCSFLLHSLVGPSGDNVEANAGAYYPLALMQYVENNDAFNEGVRKFVPLHLVKGSKTLWWIDIRDYNFTDKSWEAVASVEPYFLEPTVHHDVNGLMRLIAGNAILRMDWFNFHASDTDQEIAAGRNIKIYNTLLYSNVKEPKTVTEFEKVWGIDLARSRALGNEYGVIVTKSKGVALHNRYLFGYRTEIGWLYRSYDVLNQEGVRDYVESVYNFKGQPPPKGAFDAGEIFATNSLKMQVYALLDKDEKLVEFADSRVVRHPNDVLGNPTVRVAFGCFHCHSSGVFPSENTLKEFFTNKMSLYVTNKGDQLRIERSLLSDKFEAATEEDSKAYAKALLKVNGLDPVENEKNYLGAMVDYDAPLDLDAVARECGTTKEKIIEACSGGLNNTGKVPARLDLLTKTGEAIPRNIWDSPGKDGIPGVFQQTMSMLYGYTAVVQKVEVVTETYQIITKCNVMVGAKAVGTLDAGTILNKSQIISKEGEFVRIKTDKFEGYVSNNNLLRK